MLLLLFIVAPFQLLLCTCLCRQWSFSTSSCLAHAAQQQQQQVLHQHQHQQQHHLHRHLQLQAAAVVGPRLPAAVLLLLQRQREVLLQPVLVMVGFAFPGGAVTKSLMGLTCLGWLFLKAALQDLASR
jgi:hypothetical protein